jgi:protoporphyrinogen oxidase
MPWVAPPGKSLLTVDIGCEKTDPLWRLPDEQLADDCLDHLSRIIPDIRDRFLGAQTLRTPIAYPVFLNEYEESRVRLRESTGIAGLHSVGRNGEFAHILMEDVYWRTLSRARQVAREFEMAAA